MPGSPRWSTGRTSTTRLITLMRPSPALQQTGIRAQYAYGSANLSLADYWFNSKIAIPGDDVRRVRDTYFSSDDGLLTMGLATRGTGFCLEEVVRAEWKLARELGIPITVHVAMGRLAGRFAMIKQLDDYGLLGPDTTYIHCCHFSDEEWQLVKDSGGKISMAPQVEMQMGHGWPPMLQSLRTGSAAEPVHRRGDDGSGRHVHRNARRVRVPTAPGYTPRSTSRTSRCRRMC